NLSFAKTSTRGQVVDLSALIRTESELHDHPLAPRASSLPLPLRRPPPARPREPRLAPPARRVQENHDTAQAAHDGSPLLGLAGQSLGRVETAPRDRDSGHCLVLRWQRRRFREYWTQLSRRPTRGRPPIHAEIKALVLRMAAANPLWGAPRIHGELLKLGIAVAERTVSRLLPKRRTPPSQTWRTFLANHVRDLVSIDFFTVPTAQLRV